MTFLEKKCCVIIPTYNNSATLGRILRETLAYTEQVIVVDDGSTDGTSSILSTFVGLDVISFPENKGKGLALRAAFQFAVQNGYDYAITIDSDGQHMTADYPKFLEKLETEPAAIIVGSRNMDQESVPGKSNFGRKFSNFWFRVDTGINLPDTQSGFRLYPLAVLKGMRLFTNRYELEIEVLVRAAWKGCRVVPVPVTVYYAPKDERVSHFRPFIDFSRVSILNTVLFFLAMLYYRPLIYFRELQRQDPRQFIKQHFLHSHDSSLKLSVSVAVGVLTGILPIWGYQLILAITLAYLFKLNKVITIVAANISIPPMIPLVIFGSLYTGKLILGNGFDTFQYSYSIDFAFVRNNVQQYIVGSIVLAGILAVTFGLATYLLLLKFRKEKSGNI
jgi:glycosyltransferase involved in cell wall biosynthesis